MGRKVTREARLDELTEGREVIIDRNFAAGSDRSLIRGVPARAVVVGVQGSLFPDAGLEPLVVVTKGKRQWSIPLRCVRLAKP